MKLWPINPTERLSGINRLILCLCSNKLGNKAYILLTVCTLLFTALYGVGGQIGEVWAYARINTIELLQNNVPLRDDGIKALRRFALMYSTYTQEAKALGEKRSDMADLLS